MRHLCSLFSWEIVWYSVLIAVVIMIPTTILLEYLFRKEQKLDEFIKKHWHM